MQCIPFSKPWASFTQSRKPFIPPPVTPYFQFHSVLCSIFLSLLYFFHLSVILFFQILILRRVIASLFLNAGSLTLKQHIFTQFCVTVNYETSIIFRLMNSAWWGVCVLVRLASGENVMQRRHGLLNNAWCPYHKFPSVITEQHISPPLLSWLKVVHSPLTLWK